MKNNIQRNRKGYICQKSRINICPKVNIYGKTYIDDHMTYNLLNNLNFNNFNF